MYHEDQRAEIRGIKPTETDKGDDRTIYICPALISSTRLSISSVLKDGNKSRTRHKRKLTFKVHQEVPKGLNKHWDEKTNSGSNRQANKAGELEPTLCVCGSNQLGWIPVGCRCECLSHLSKVCPAFCLFEQLEQAPPTTLNWTNGWGNG